MAGRMLSSKNAALIVVDVQGKLARLIDGSESMIERMSILIKGCQRIGLPLIWAEQVPEKLGSTVPEIAELLEELRPVQKNSFGCLGDNRFYEHINKLGREQMLICGIETHVCVFQTAARLLEEGFQAHVVADAVGSRNAQDREVGLQRMRDAGAIISSVEMALFELMRDTSHPAFREITKLLK